MKQVTAQAVQALKDIAGNKHHVLDANDQHIDFAARDSKLKVILQTHASITYHPRLRHVQGRIDWAVLVVPEAAYIAVIAEASKPRLHSVGQFTKGDSTTTYPIFDADGTHDATVQENSQQAIVEIVATGERYDLLKTQIELEDKTVTRYLVREEKPFRSSFRAACFVINGGIDEGEDSEDSDDEESDNSEE